MEALNFLGEVDQEGKDSGNCSYADIPMKVGQVGETGSNRFTCIQKLRGGFADITVDKPGPSW